MVVVQVLAVVTGVALIFVVLRDAFATIVLPRRPTGRLRLTLLFFKSTWTFTRRLALIAKGDRRESMLSYYGPLWMISLIVSWEVIILFAFAFIHWGTGSNINVNEGHASFLMDVYLSGSTLFTLGLGDVTPAAPLDRFLTVVEAGFGLGFLALVIGYLPVLYSAFSRREVLISLFDARAGSPPSASELIRRHSARADPTELNRTLEEFERWSAELLETHISYPVLAFYRSQHDKQSWLAAIATILDTTAALRASGDPRFADQAKLTFAMARHTVIDLSGVLRAFPAPGEPRLAPADFEHLWLLLLGSGLSLPPREEFHRRLYEICETYEPHISALADWLVIPLPAWLPEVDARDDWQTGMQEKTH